MTEKKITIAIDGYSSTGKSSMAKTLARSIGYRYIDSGAMYRAVSLYALKHSLIDKNGVINEQGIIDSLNNIVIEFEVTREGIQDTIMNGQNVEKEIREMEVSRVVSQVASIKKVREDLVSRQKKLGENGGVVMDGRDIGTTVFPLAELKVFVTASPAVRAQRRFLELKSQGEEVGFEEILENVKKRDYLDEHREISPLRCAWDAIVLDNTNMSKEEQNKFMFDLYREKIKS